MSVHQRSREGESGRANSSTSTVMGAPDRDALRTLIESCVDDGGTIEEAHQLLVVALAEKPDLYTALLAPAIENATRAAISQEFARRRAQIWKAEEPAYVRPLAPDARARILSSVNTAALLEFPLPGGKRLRRATSDDLAVAAAFYLSRAADMAWKGKWLAAIAAEMEPGETVEDTFSEADLVRIKEEQA